MSKLTFPEIEIDAEAAKLSDFRLSRDDQDLLPACKTCGEPTSSIECPNCGAGISANSTTRATNPAMIHEEYVGDGMYRDADGVLWFGDFMPDSGKDTPDWMKISDEEIEDSCRR